MKIRQYFKKISPETKSMLRKVLWLLILCVLAFATGYYASQDKMDKVLTTNLQIFNDSIKVSKLRQDSLVLYIKALEERKQQIIYKTKTIVKEYEKNIDDFFICFISSVCQLNDHCKKPNGEYTYG